MRSVRIVLVAVSLSAAMLVGAPAAMADDTPCTGTLPPGVYDNVIVPPGAGCILFDSDVQGNLKVLEGGTLEHGGTDVGGNIQVEKARRVSLFGGTVGENIQISETGGDHPLDVGVCAMVLPNGNVELTKNVGGLHVGFPGIGCPVNTVSTGNISAYENVAEVHLVIEGNTVGQNLQVLKTTGPANKRVQGNTVGQSVQCFDNAAPFVGGPNTAPKKEGQCF